MKYKLLIIAFIFVGCFGKANDENPSHNKISNVEMVIGEET